MKIDNSDSLFGVDEFEPEKNDNSEEFLPVESSVAKSENQELSSENDTIPNGTESDNGFTIYNPLPVFSKGLILTFIFMVLSIFVVISVVSLHVKTKRNALSYELSAQTKLMKRLEKRKAMFELENSFLRSNESISSKIEEKEWKEITPQSIKFIRIDQKK